MLGLRRGEVILCDHEKEWEEIAEKTIHKLKNILGATAIDIQHIGSTAIYNIKAKPIIDIAVGVNDFEEVIKLTSKLEENGFCRRNWHNEEQILFAIGDYTKPDGIVTHFIHVVKSDSDEFANYIKFRDYLNNNIDDAKIYEEVKVKLAMKNPHDKGREKYLAGKYDCIMNIMKKAKAFRTL